MINDKHKQNLTRERLIESGSIQKNNQLKHDDDDLLYTFLDLEPRPILDEASLSVEPTHSSTEKIATRNVIPSLMLSFISPRRRSKKKTLRWRQERCLQTQIEDGRRQTRVNVANYSHLLKRHLASLHSAHRPPINVIGSAKVFHFPQQTYPLDNSISEAFWRKNRPENLRFPSRETRKELLGVWIEVKIDKALDGESVSSPMAQNTTKKKKKNENHKKWFCVS